MLNKDNENDQDQENVPQARPNNKIWEWTDIDNLPNNIVFIDEPGLILHAIQEILVTNLNLVKFVGRCFGEFGGLYSTAIVYFTYNYKYKNIYCY